MDSLEINWVYHQLAKIFVVFFGYVHGVLTEVDRCLMMSKNLKNENMYETNQEVHLQELIYRVYRKSFFKKNFGSDFGWSFCDTPHAVVNIVRQYCVARWDAGYDAWNGPLQVGPSLVD